MPFLINLTVQERKGIFKAGPDSISFIRNALTAAEDHPDILPRSFDVLFWGSSGMWNFSRR
uniref:Uncharacterized protein n=1 Tax=Candidatus Kentrum sp. DK TaxID=2126562 RepID=A0A450SJC1_9GAMM|nr:MAG: hypothetical protein BECKDK2373C_GA0170839_100729 [Candidatus Kentron sp. DK]VFJ53468.1 MAG: hypothetical protein BECKDK2373B_GA0170837_104228 [Candidatus Kentron sp. DK]